VKAIVDLLVMTGANPSVRFPHPEDLRWLSHFSKSLKPIATPDLHQFLHTASRDFCGPPLGMLLGDVPSGR
jgi:hypothetical protein